MVGDLGRVYSDGCELSLIGGRFVNLCWKREMKRVDVAYLVARAFLGNVRGCEWVRHKDGDLRNNRVENLEWVEVRPEMRGGGRKAERRQVVQYTLDGTGIVGMYDSIKEASEETGVARSLIRNCAEGRAKRAKQWIFRYV